MSFELEAMASSSAPKVSLEKKKVRVIVISGPTAVGKTRIALALAKRLNGEIVSADSVQVYKGLDVGSAKTPLHEREGVLHHLLDVVDPTEEYTVGAFFDDARRATSQVLTKGHVPIVVGGTGLYMRWFLGGKPGTPKESPEVTAQVDAEVSAFQNAGDWDGAVELLEKAGDTSTSSNLSRNDWYRLRRALSIIKATGLPRSHFPEHGLGQDDYEFMCYFLYKPRIELYRGIDARCEDMLATTGVQTILSEASWLLDLGIKPETSPPSRAIGYRQAMEYLLRCRSAGGKSTEEEFLKFLCSFQQASRNYARRQLTWFRNEKLFRWIDATQPVEKIVEFMTDEYYKPPGLNIESRVVLAAEVVDKRERAQLKAYVPKNKIFLSSTPILPVLEWIEKTQGEKTELAPTK